MERITIQAEVPEGRKVDLQKDLQETLTRYDAKNVEFRTGWGEPQHQDPAAQGRQRGTY